MSALGWLLVLVAAGALTARFLPAVNRVVVGIAALAPYLMLGAPLGVLVFGLPQRWPPAAAAAALTLAAVAAHLPWHLGTRRAGSGATVRFVSTNLYLGRADPTAVAGLAGDNADVLAVQELTGDLAEALSHALAADFPHSVVRPRDKAAGVGLWSRFPILDSGSDESFSRGFIHARVRVADTELTVVSTHMPPPRSDFAAWRDDIRRLGTALRALPAPGPVVVGADLNATPDLHEFRRLLRDGYRDGAAQVGAGLTRTYPSNSVLPPLFAVDHIMTCDATVTSLRTVEMAGSDHLALVASVALG